MKAEISFTQLPIPQRLKREYRRCGAKKLRRFAADLPDGVLRVMIGVEPVEEGMRHHVSVSVAASPELGESPKRRPMGQEIEAALGLVSHVRRWSEMESHSDIRHFWET